MTPEQQRLEEMKAVLSDPQVQQTLAIISAAGKDFYHNKDTVIQIHSRGAGENITFNILAEDVTSFPGTTLRLTVDEDGNLIKDEILDNR